MTAAKPDSALTIVLDFDGTVTRDDMLDTVAQVFGDPDVYAEVETGLDEGRMPLREVITREFAPVRAPLAEVVEWVLARVRVRPGLRELVRLAEQRGWRIVVVSSGFAELIEPVLQREGVDVEVRANAVRPDPTGWQVVWQYDPSCDSCGESCKRSVVAEMTAGGSVVYVGDGYSDRCAAKAADRVFATRGLADYLTREGVAFEPFSDFHDVATVLAA